VRLGARPGRARGPARHGAAGRAAGRRAHRLGAADPAGRGDDGGDAEARAGAVGAEVRGVIRVSGRSPARGAALPCAVLTILLAALTVSVQVKHLGLRYVDSGKQVRLYQSMLEGHSGDPWQYRVLSMGILRCTLAAFRGL